MLRPRHFFTLRAEQSLVRCPGKPSGPGHQKAHHAAHQSRAKTKQLLAVPNIRPTALPNDAAVSSSSATTAAAATLRLMQLKYQHNTQRGEQAYPFSCIR